MSVIVRGKNPRKPHTVRFWVDGKQRERSFATAREARDFKTKTDYDTRASIFVDDRLGREKFRTVAGAWIERKAIMDSTKAAYQSSLDVHIGPALGDRTLASVANDRDAVTDLLVIKMAGLSYTLRKTARLIITGVLDKAVTAGKLQSHHCAGIEIVSGARKSDRTDFIFPGHGQLAMLAAGVSHPLTIWLMRGCGLRIQEAMAVQKSCFRDGGRTLLPEGIHAQRQGCADPRWVHPSQPASRVRVGSAGAQCADHRCCAVARAPGYQGDVPHLRPPDSVSIGRISRVARAFVLSPSVTKR